MENNGSLVNRELFKKGDIVIILLILLFGCIIFLINKPQKEGKLTAVIYDNGKAIKKINLEDVDEPYNLTIDEKNNLVVRVEKGKIRYLSSNCEDKICVNSGWLGKHGDFAACAPFKSAISVTGRAEGGEDPDIIIN